MKRKIAILVALFLILSGCFGSKKKDPVGPGDPEGTIIGNPAPSAPPAGTFNIYTDAGALRYRVVVQIDGSADVTIYNDDGTVQETTSGRFTQTETSESSSTFALEINLSDGSRVVITLTSNTDNTITDVSLSLNGQPASAVVEFVMPGGATTTFTLTGEVSIEPPPPCPSASECFDLAMTALGTAQITTAQTYFDQAVVFDTSHSSSHFGAALARILLLPQSVPVISLQDGLGQEHFTTDDAVGPNSYLDQLNEFNAGRRAEDPDLSRFPYGYLREPREGPSDNFSLGEILARALNGFTAEDAQQNLATLRTGMDAIIDSLDSAREDASFEFTIPGALYYSDDNIVVGRADVTLLLSGFYFAQSSLSFANTWRFDIDLGILYTAEGNNETDPETLIGTFNQFFRLRSTDELAEAQSALANALTTLIEGLGQLPTDPAPGVFETSALTSAGLTELADLARAINLSFGGLTTLPGTTPVTSINLSNLFSDPPDLDDIGIDPFVVDDGRVELVEAFFQEMINRALVGFDLDQESFEILASITGDASEAFYQDLFSEFRDFTVSGENLWESR
ncbi:MAG: hypothetical protein HYT76_00310 [Deltaproteobacteria bacterium]|nr:hypothetical protein [Deltaproteobacteria bacterium]